MKNVVFKNRALVIIVENDDSPGLSNTIYEQNKNIILPIFSSAFKTSQQELNNLTLVEIFDHHGEPFIANQFSKAAKHYSKKVILMDEDASLQNFVNIVDLLTQEGYTVDIVVDLHGSNSIYFFDDSYSDEEISAAFEDKSHELGFVYQTVCWGSKHIDLWKSLGAEEVNGATNANSYVILAPKVFLKEISKGTQFRTAVERGYNKEVKAWKLVIKLVPDLAEWTSEETLEDSKMKFEEISETSQ